MRTIIFALSILGLAAASAAATVDCDKIADPKLKQQCIQQATPVKAPTSPPPQAKPVVVPPAKTPVAAQSSPLPLAPKSATNVPPKVGPTLAPLATTPKTLAPLPAPTLPSSTPQTAIKPAPLALTPAQPVKTSPTQTPLPAPTSPSSTPQTAIKPAPLALTPAQPPKANLVAAALARVPISSCGSTWYQRTGLQVQEAWQANATGTSFESVCLGHDACYANRDCKISKQYCDEQLLREATDVCRAGSDPIARTKCTAAANVFYQAVNRFGDSAFANARASLNCTLIQSLPYATIRGTK